MHCRGEPANCRWMWGRLCLTPHWNIWETESNCVWSIRLQKSLGLIGLAANFSIKQRNPENFIFHDQAYMAPAVTYTMSAKILLVKAVVAMIDLRNRPIPLNCHYDWLYINSAIACRIGCSIWYYFNFRYFFRKYFGRVHIFWGGRRRRWLGSW